MHKQLIVTFALLILAGCGRSEEAASDPTSSFDRFFELEETIQLPDYPYVGSISGLDADPRGRLLLTEVMRSVWLFDPSTQEIVELSPAACHESWKWLPMMARFGPDFILVASTGPFGFRLDENGNCETVLVDDFVLPRNMAIEVTGTVVGYHPYPDGIRIRAYTPGGVETGRRRVDVPFPALNSRVGAGGIIARDDTIFLSVATSPELWKLTLDGYETTLGSESSSFRSHRGSDAPTNPSDGDMMQIGTLIQSISVGSHIFDLGEVLVHVHFHSHADAESLSRYTLNLFDRDGNPLTLDGIPTHLNFLHGSNGRLYRVSHETMKESAAPNPSIEVYRLRRSSLSL